ncbi:MAG: YihY/virulence factor BrkB family protein [Rhodocyclaceae bacterium]|nr:YihY/virulence factor BrkB family protein [Rhodocyclaceae bacterium]
MSTSRPTSHRTLPPWASRVVRIAAATADAWMQDRCASMAAALAFYAAFSLAPLLVVAVAVGSIFFGERAIEGRLYTELESLIGRDAALAAQAVLANAWRAGQARTLGWLSLAATWLGATATFAELNSALNAIWHAPPSRRFLATLIRVRLVSFGLVVGAGFLLVVLLIADAIILYITEAAFAHGILGALIGTIQQLASFGFLCLAFTVLLKVLPDVPVAWRDALAGSAAGAVLFAVGKHLFAIYLAHASSANVFGAASSLAALMMWLFFSAVAFLVGAELAAALGRERRLPTPPPD